MGWRSDSAPFQGLLDLTSVNNDTRTLAKVVVTSTYMYLADFPRILSIYPVCAARKQATIIKQKKVALGGTQ
jgi:hypothetical protein